MIRQTKKQKKYIKSLAEGKTKTNAKLKAGYSEKSSTAVIEELKGVKGYLEELENMLPDKKLIKPIVKGLEATKTANYEGEVCSSDEPDHDTQLKAAELGFKLKGRLKQAEVQVVVPIKVTWKE